MSHNKEHRFQVHDLIHGNVTVYEDDYGKYIVSVSIQNQKSPYPKLFQSFDTAMKHANWIIRNWQDQIKQVNIIKTTPLTYK